MHPLQVSLFGRFRVQSAGKVVIGFNAQKVQELFSYLLIRRQSPQNREFLASLLWEDASTAHSQQYFRKTLWQLQSALNKSIPGNDLLLVDDEWIQVNRLVNCRLDLADFEDTYCRVKKMHGGDLKASDVDAIVNVLKLYQGELLQGWYQNWCLTERERLQHIYLVMLDKLVDYSLVQSQYTQGIEYALQILRCDLARECTYRQVIFMLAMSGDRTGAIRMYERCVKVLATELGVEPASSTVELYQQICRDSQPPTYPLLATTQKPAQQVSTQLQAVSQCLLELRTTLSGVQEQINVQLATLAQILGNPPHDQ